MSIELTPSYWNERYESHRDGWDLGSANSALVAEVTKRLERTDTILFPGAGRGYEADYLWAQGYTGVTVCDWSAASLSDLRSSPHLPSPGNVIIEDFFELTGRYDAIVEQTFFCALEPNLRERYVGQCTDLLRAGGWYIGLLFDRDFPAGPPFGGSSAEYAQLFGSYFDIEVLESFDGSIGPRAGNEVLLVARNA